MDIETNPPPPKIIAPPRLDRYVICVTPRNPTYTIPFSNRIAKNWSGELFINVSANKAQSLCSVTLADTTKHLPEGLRFNILLSSLNSLRLKKCYYANYWTVLKRAYKPQVQQIGRLKPLKDVDAAALKAFASHLKRKDMVRLPPELLSIGSQCFFCVVLHY